MTLGVGDIVPLTTAYKLLTPLATLHGLFTITLAITYLLPVMSAAVERRRQATTIWGMGGKVTRIVVEGWSTGSFDDLEDGFQSLTEDLLTTVARHPTYPVLHYFVTEAPRTSFAARVAALDDALRLLLHAVDGPARPSLTVLTPLRRAVDAMLGYAPSHDDDIQEPPRQALEPLRAAGIPLRPEAEVELAFSNLATRRRSLLALVQSAASRWPDVEAAPDPLH